MRGTTGFPVRLTYSKRGKVRWISHRDVARAFERAFRIEQLPLAFTEGFSPRPKVSFGLALSTGHESDAEYLDLELVAETDLDALPRAISGALPDGITVVGAVGLVDRAPALMDVVTSVEWEVSVVDRDAAPLARGADVRRSGCDAITGARNPAPPERARGDRGCPAGDREHRRARRSQRERLARHDGTAYATA